MLHSDAPDWFPPALAAQLDGVGFAKKPRFLELITDLSPGDALVEFLERATVSQPDVVLLGACLLGTPCFAQRSPEQCLPLLRVAAALAWPDGCACRHARLHRLAPLPGGLHLILRGGV